MIAPVTRTGSRGFGTFIEGLGYAPRYSTHTEPTKVSESPAKTGRSSASEEPKFASRGGDDLWTTSFHATEEIVDELDVRNATERDNSDTPLRRILESFDGYLEEVRDEVAYVTLTSRDAEELIGEYPANKLLEKGIREGRRFICRTVQSNGAVNIEFEAVPDRELSAAEEQAISQEIEASLGDADLDGDD